MTYSATRQVGVMRYDVVSCGERDTDA